VVELVDPRFIPSVVAGGFLVFIALGVLYIDFSSRLHRAFALYLVLLAGITAFPAFDASADSLWGKMRAHFFVALPFSAAHLFLTYWRKFRETPPPAVLRAGVTSATLALLALGSVLVLLIDFSWYWTLERDGPFVLSLPMRELSMALIGILLLHESFRTNSFVKRRALQLTALAFTVPAAYLTFFISPFAFPNGFGLGKANSLGSAAWFLRYVSVALLLAQFVVLALAARNRAPTSATAEGELRLEIYAGSVLAAMLLGFVMFLAVHFNRIRIKDLVYWGFTLIGLAKILMASLVGVALVRYRLLDVDVRFQWAVSRSTMAGIMLAVFFMVSEAAQTAFSDKAAIINPDWAPYIGIVGASALLFAIHPLERLTDRLAAKGVPRMKPVEELTPAQRLEIYREQASIAWLDGTLTAKERHLLDSLRDRFGLSLEETHRAESDAMPPIPSRKRSRG
jgi:hypothetical protein